MFSVRTTPEELENGVFILVKNSVNVFRLHYATITGHFEFVVEENSTREIT